MEELVRAQAAEAAARGGTVTSPGGTTRSVGGSKGDGFGRPGAGGGGSGAGGPEFLHESHDEHAEDGGVDALPDFVCQHKPACVAAGKVRRQTTLAVVTV
jgi:hypothetical protein